MTDDELADWAQAEMDRRAEQAWDLEHQRDRDEEAFNEILLRQEDDEP